jgi:hypothetical protein
MMIDSKIYKGIEYVQLNELPQVQREKLSETLNKDLFIKIMIDGKIVNDCLQFKDYSFWYNSVYKPATQNISEPIGIKPVQFENNQLALNSR